MMRWYGPLLLLHMWFHAASADHLKIEGSNNLPFT
jgi:hypothetical protein